MVYKENYFYDLNQLLFVKKFPQKDISFPGEEDTCYQLLKKVIQQDLNNEPIYATLLK